MTVIHTDGKSVWQNIEEGSEIKTGSSFPERVNILGVDYSIEYMDNPAEVDLYQRQSLWGQIDFWTRTIRVYKHGRPIQDIWHTIIHEVLHGIVGDLNLQAFDGGEDEEELDRIALALTDVFVRNGWLRIDR